jgi:hypothetical protein
VSAPRENWRDIPVVDLTDSEVALMTRQEGIWCADMLIERLRLRTSAAMAAPVTPALAIDGAGTGAGE